MVVDEKRWKTFKAKLKVITRKTSPMSFDERVQKLKEVYRGRINYFKFASMSEKLKDVDGWLRNRIRYCIWHDWKNLAAGDLTTVGSKPERKRKNLLRLGVSSEHAYSWSRCRKGGWATAKPSRIPIKINSI